MVMTGFGLGWINIAADWTRYQKRTASDGAIIFWNTFGASVAPIPLVLVGLLLAGSDPALSEAINSIIDTKEKKDIDSLFKSGGTSALTSAAVGADDFELICFVVVK